MKTIADATQKFKNLFPEGSMEDEFTDSKSSAKADVWKNMKDFLEKLEALRMVTIKVSGTTKDGLNAFRAGVGNVGKACKACHEKYRLKRE